MTITNCPICNSILFSYRESINNNDMMDHYSCPLCGKYIMWRGLLSALQKLMDSDKDSIAKISRVIRSMSDNNEKVDVDQNFIEKALALLLPNPKEQADLLICWLGNNVKGPGEYVLVESKTHRSIIGAKSDSGFGLIIHHLIDTGLIISNSPFFVSVTLTFKGWEYYEKLKLGGTSYRKAFMAMKFGDVELDKIVEDTFKQCVEETGFKLRRLNDEPKAGLIDNRLRVEIQSSDFVIADLSHNNNGAYWEAGYAEGLGKEVIYTCEKKKFKRAKTHFDTNHHQTIVWDVNNPKQAGEDLKATIRATLPHLVKIE